MQKFQEHLPDWGDFATSISYVDPMNATKPDLDVYTCKHFRYAYQKEYRVISLPSNAVKLLKPIDIKLGSIKEYCELICL